jgi:hypothetical protein
MHSFALNTATSEGTFSGPAMLAPTAGPAPAPVLNDPALRNLLELRSGDPVRIAAALKRIDSLAPIEVPQVIELLDRDESPRRRTSPSENPETASRAS